MFKPHPKSIKLLQLFIIFYGKCLIDTPTMLIRPKQLFVLFYVAAVAFLSGVSLKFYLILPKQLSMASSIKLITGLLAANQSYKWAGFSVFSHRLVRNWNYCATFTKYRFGHWFVRNSLWQRGQGFIRHQGIFAIWNFYKKKKANGGYKHNQKTTFVVKHYKTWPFVCGNIHLQKWRLDY